MKFDISKAISQGIKQDWHINYEADGSSGTNITYICTSVSVTYYVGDYKDLIQAQNGGSFASIVAL
jgi:hypothetical protein